MLANENDAFRVRNLFRGDFEQDRAFIVSYFSGSGVKLAWLGIVAKPNGHQIFLNGLDATANHFGKQRSVQKQTSQRAEVKFEPSFSYKALERLKLGYGDGF